MPHVVVLYTANLEDEGRLSTLCRSLADVLLAQRDERDAPVFPAGGTRVFALPSAHHAVSDGGAAGQAAGETGDYAFVFVNLRMGRGRSDAVKQATGDALVAATRAHFEPVLARRRVGITVQVDESPGQVYDGKAGNLHDLFRK